MTKEIQKQGNQVTEQIAQSELLTQLRLIMQDVFIGEIKEDSGEITVQFLNGQKFRVAVLAA